MGSDTPNSHNITTRETQRIVNLRTNDEPNAHVIKRRCLLGLTLRIQQTSHALEAQHTHKISTMADRRDEKNLQKKIFINIEIALRWTCQAATKQKYRSKCNKSKNNTTLCFAFQLHRISVERRCSLALIIRNPGSA